MKKKNFWLALMVALVLIPVAFVFTACGGDDGNKKPQLVSITASVTSENPYLTANLSVEYGTQINFDFNRDFKVEAYYTDNTTKVLTYANGEYTVDCGAFVNNSSLNPASNTAYELTFKAGEAQATISFHVLKKQIPVPTVNGGAAFTYTGSEIDIAMGYIDYLGCEVFVDIVDKEGDLTKATDAGDYYVTFKIKDIFKQNFEFMGGAEEVSVKWTIAPAQLNKSEVLSWVSRTDGKDISSSDAFTFKYEMVNGVFTPTEQGFNVNIPDEYQGAFEVSGAKAAVGGSTLEIKLKSANYCLVDDGAVIEDGKISIGYNINKMKLSVPSGLSWTHPGAVKVNGTESCTNRLNLSEWQYAQFVDVNYITKDSNGNEFNDVTSAGVYTTTAKFSINDDYVKYFVLDGADTENNITESVTWVVSVAPKDAITSVKVTDGNGESVITTIDKLLEKGAANGWQIELTMGAGSGFSNPGAATVRDNFDGYFKIELNSDDGEASCTLLIKIISNDSIGDLYNQTNQN